MVKIFPLCPSHSFFQVSNNKIRSRKWDVVILQEQSQMPCFPQVCSETIPSLKNLERTIRANNPSTTIQVRKSCIFIPTSVKNLYFITIFQRTQTLFHLILFSCMELGVDLANVIGLIKHVFLKDIKPLHAWLLSHPGKLKFITLPFHQKNYI